MPVSGDSISDSSCVYIPQWDGMPVDQLAATIANIGIAVIGILSLLYYGAHAYFATCGWEEVYVCVIERKWGAWGHQVCHASIHTHCMHSITAVQ